MNRWMKAACRAAVVGAALAGAVQAEFKVVGYIMGSNGVPAAQYKKLTHIIWSFAYPQDDGSITGINASALNNLVTAAHANKVKVFLALGGGSNGDKGWIAATATDAARRNLTKSCMDAVRTYKLDGIDFDWEYPDGASQVASFNAAVKMLAAELHAEGKEISSAVTYNDWPRSFPTNELFSHFDFLNIMIYDNPAPHSTVAHVNTSLDIWVKTKGLPKEKFMVGCPFYGPGGQYREIVAANPAAAWVDNNGAEGYNSIPTMRKKTEIGLQRAGGMMFWQLAQDAPGDLSLLSAVHEVVLKSGPTGILTIKPVSGPGMAGPRRTGGVMAYGKTYGNTSVMGLSSSWFDPAGRRLNEISIRIP